MNYNVIRYNQEYKQQWDDFVRTAKNATFLFYRDFMDYHNDRFEDYSLMVYKDNKLFALLPANKVENKIYSHQGLTYGGYILSEKAKLLESVEGFKMLLGFLNDHGIEYLDIRDIPSFYNLLPSDELTFIMFKANAELIKRDAIMLIDFRNKLLPIKSRRQCIKRGMNSGLKIKVDDSFEAFWNEILIPNLKNKHGVSPVHTLEEIQLLASRFPENIQQVNVYKDNKIVAGTTVFLTKTTIHPQYVSANEDKNALESIDFLYNFLINDFQSYYYYFDFNISSEEKGKILNKGLLFWKESYGARTFTADNYVVETSAYKNLNLQLK